MEKLLAKIEKYILYFVVFLFPFFVLSISPNPFVVPKIALLSLGVALILLVRALRVITAGKLEFSVGNFDFPVFLNADHFKSFEKCKAAIDAGYDSILIDSSKLSFQENADLTKRVVEYARSKNPNISIEGELGYLRGSSEVQKKIEISSQDYTKPEEAVNFVATTGVDRLAVVFGNIHGIVTDQVEKLDINHFAKIVSQLPEMFFVLHGASGLDDKDIGLAIETGIVNVHFNTELRVAYQEALKESLENSPQETTPYKYLASSVGEIKKLVIAKNKIFLGAL